MEVYEFKLEDLETTEDLDLSDEQKNDKNILNSNVKVDVLIGKANQTVREILNLSVGNIITLDKNIDEKLGIYVNGNKIANGESIVLDNKIAVRISEAESEDDN